MERLIAHRGNTNRMSKANFAKLVSHIRRTGRYEPVIVRDLPGEGGSRQILNGHHRVKALEQLGYSSVDCICWKVDEGEADILLATLNRLSGRDDIHKRSELVRRLMGRFSIEQMARMLPESRKQIERLRELSKPIELCSTKPFANPVVFFLTNEQKAVMEKALTLACNSRCAGANAKAQALTRVAQFFIDNQREKESCASMAKEETNEKE